MLDVYLDTVDSYHRQLEAAKNAPPAATAEKTASADKAPVDPGVRPASTASYGATPARELVRNPAEGITVPAAGTAGAGSSNVTSLRAPHLGLDQGPVYGSASWRDSSSKKEKARWLMQNAREQIFKEHFEIAEQLIAEARAMDVKWTVFDETPDRMTEALEKARQKKATAIALATPGPHDRRAAKTRLREARAALAANDLDRAESIARDVKAWGLIFMFFDDSPDKVVSAVAETRQRQGIKPIEPPDIKSMITEQPRPDQAAISQPPTTAPATAPAPAPSPVTLSQPPATVPATAPTSVPITLPPPGSTSGPTEPR